MLLNTKENKWPSSLTWLAVIGCAYFMAYLIFSFIFYKERLMVDGSYKVFEMCNTKWFPYTQNRFIIYLLYFIPVLAVNIGLPIKVVIFSWIFNYFIFYMLCFGVIVFIFRDWAGGWVMICIHAFTMGTSFYNLADEILPPSMFIIILFSIFNNRPSSHGCIVFILFFIAFSHLVAVLALAMICLYFVFTDPAGCKKLFIKNIYWIVLFVIMFIVRFILALGDTYENGRMSVTPGRITDLLHHLNIAYIRGFISFLSATEFIVCGFLGALIVTLIKKRKWQNLIWLILFLSAYTLTWLFYVDPLDPRYLNRYDHLTVRWFFPFGFFCIFFFFREMIISKDKQPAYLWFSYTIIALLAVQYAWLYKYADFAINNVKQFELLIQAARRDGIAKSYINMNATCSRVYYHRVTTSAIVYSSLASADSTIHVIIADSTEIAQIRSTSPDIFYQSFDRTFPQDQLNKHYFNLSTGRYYPLKNVHIDCNDLI